MSIYGPTVREAYAGAIPKRCYEPFEPNRADNEWRDMVLWHRMREQRAELARESVLCSPDRHSWSSKIAPGNRTAVSNDGQVYHPGDSDETPTCPVSRTVGVRNKLLAQAVFTRLLREQTGETIEIAKLETKRQERGRLLAQSHEVARRLLGKGINLYRSDAWHLATYNVQSGEIDELPKFARSCMLPTMAAQLRAPYINALDYFADRHPFLRFWTFTSGRRVKIGQLRRRCEEMHRRLSKLNDADFMKTAGVRIIFRSTEFGTPEFDDARQARREKDVGLLERDENGAVLLHPHAHCVVYLCNGPLPMATNEQNPEPGTWEALLKDVWQWWGHNWDDGGCIQGMREVCKYVTKPKELLALTDNELAALYWQVKGLKLVQPMADLAEDMRRRREASPPLMLAKKRTPEGKIWIEIVNPNAGEKKRKEEADLEAASKLDRREVPASCFVVCRCLPAFNSHGVKEPRVMFMYNAQIDRAALANHPLVQRMRVQTREEYLAGMRLQGLMAMQDTGGISVHTCTSTVREEADDDPPPDVLEPINTADLFELAGNPPN